MQQLANRLLAIENTEIKKEIHDLLNWVKITLAEPAIPTDSTKDLFAHDTVLRIMSAHIKIQPSNHEFWLEGNTSILEAGVRSGLSLNYGCTNGNCGLCKARVVSGEVKKIHNHDYVLSEAEKNMNYILLCSCTAVSDVVIEALEAKGENDIPRQEVITKVKKLDNLTDDVMALHLQTPRVQRLRFLAGQSVTLTLPNGKSIDLPIASCPCDDRNLIFHIRKQADNEIANAIIEHSGKGQDITVTGPHGHFLLNETSKRKQVYIAYDTGFAPIKSLIEHAMALDDSANMYLYWVGEKKEDLYLNNLCRSWDDALEDFHYHPVINADPIQALTHATPNLKDCDVYLAGPKTQIHKIKETLLTAGLPENQLITDQVS